MKFFFPAEEKPYKVIESYEMIHMCMGDKNMGKPKKLPRRDMADLPDIKKYCSLFEKKIYIETRVSERAVDKAGMKQRLHVFPLQRAVVVVINFSRTKPVLYTIIIPSKGKFHIVHSLVKNRTLFGIEAVGNLCPESFDSINFMLAWRKSFRYFANVQFSNFYGGKREMIRILSVSLFFIYVMSATCAIADDTNTCEGLLRQTEESSQSLRKENAILQEKIDAIEKVPFLTSEALSFKSSRRIVEIEGDIRVQRQSMKDFEAYVKWMSANLSGYSKYIEAGSFAAGFAKVLPIPYAGQASVLTKFISQGVLALNSASVSIARYLSTSGQFISMAETVAKGTSGRSPGDLSAVVRFADERLLSDMNDARTKLAATVEISSSTLSFLESINHYAGCTDEYWNKTKSLISRKEADKSERSYLSQSIQNLKNGAAAFNAKLKLFEESTKKDEPLIKSLVTYDELIREISEKTVTADEAGRQAAVIIKR